MSTRRFEDGTIEAWAGRPAEPNRLYLAGPMRGIPEFNFPAFEAAARVLRAQGFEVWTPHERDLANGFDPSGMTGDEDLAALGFELDVALTDDLAYVNMQAEAIALLPGWENSKGVRAELAAAAALGKPAGTVVAFAEGLPLSPADRYLERWGTPQQSANSALDGMRLDDLVLDVYAPAMEAQRKADETAMGFVTFDGLYVSTPGEAITTGEVRVTSSSGGQKGMKLARFDLLPWDVLWTVAELYGKGAAKYEARNWERGYDWSLSFASLMRHATQFWQGEDNDPETGLPHLASAVFHGLGLLRFMREHPEFDDRPSTLLRRQEAA